MNNNINFKPILPIKGDVVFKGFFSDKSNEPFLIDLVNHYTNIDIDINEKIDVAIPELPPLDYKDKRPRLDLRVKTKQGEYVNIEVQVDYYEHILKRVQYYNHKIFASQLSSGEDYDKLERVISLTFLYENIFDNNDYINHIVYYHQEGGKIIKTMGAFVYVEIKKLVGIDDMWAQLMSAESEEDFLAIEKRGGMMAEVVERLRLFSQDEEVRYQQEMIEKYERDQRYLKKQAKRMGLAEGREEGLKLGIEEGIKQGVERGIEQGIEQGAAQTASELAKKMLAKGYPVKDIIELTGITKEQLK